MWAQQEQRSPGRIVSGAGSLKSPGKKGGADFSPRPRQRACQDPLTRQGGDALRDGHFEQISAACVRFARWTSSAPEC